MAKGKQAAAAANRRLEAANDHIDRLTDEIVTWKTRARDAEAKLSQMEALESLAERADLRRDSVIEGYRTELRDWIRWYDKQKDLRREAIHELLKLVRDSGVFTKAELLNLALADRVEFINKRYPKIVMVLAGHNTFVSNTLGVERPERLSETAVKRLQRARGMRGVFTDDDGNPQTNDVGMGEMLVLALEAIHEGMDAAEVMEALT